MRGPSRIKSTMTTIIFSRNKLEARAWGLAGAKHLVKKRELEFWRVPNIWFCSYQESRLFIFQVV
jgi:hypothetical protein